MDGGGANRSYWKQTLGTPVEVLCNPIRGAALSGSQSLYPKVVQLFAGTKLRPQPTRLFATACPGLRGILRISILGKNLRIRATMVLHPVTAGGKLMKALIKPAFFGRYFAAQFGNHLFVKVP
jgi:hypothetical protein